MIILILFIKCQIIKKLIYFAFIDIKQEEISVFIVYKEFYSWTFFFESKYFVYQFNKPVC